MRACEQLQKFCEHEQASTRVINFCEQFEQRPNFASTFKLNGTIRYPFDATNSLYFPLTFQKTKALFFPDCAFLNTPLVKTRNEQDRQLSHLLNQASFPGLSSEPSSLGASTRSPQRVMFEDVFEGFVCDWSGWFTFG